MREFKVIKNFVVEVVIGIFILLHVASDCESFSWGSTPSFIVNKGALWRNGISQSVLAGGFLLANSFIVSSSGSVISGKSNLMTKSKNRSSRKDPKETLLKPSLPKNEPITISAPDTQSSTDYDDESSSAVKANAYGHQSIAVSNNNRYRHRPRGVKKMKSDKERLRLELLKQIKSLDHMKCFPKVLCGLSVDSSKTSSGIDSHLVRSYIQLMRSAQPEDDSSEESKPSMDSTKDALSHFLMKSGILRPMELKQTPIRDTSVSQSSTSVSEEDYPSEEDYTPLKSSIELKNEQLKKLLNANISKRKLDIEDEDDIKVHQDRLDGHQNHNHRSDLFMSNLAKTEEDELSKITSQIGSLVSSWVPWVSFSFGSDSFEKDPFFTGGGNKNKSAPPKKDQNVKHEQDEIWKKELDKLAYLMKLKHSVNKRKHYEKIRQRIGARGVNTSAADSNSTMRSGKDIKLAEDEMVIYSTAVDIGKKLKDTRQCDYLYNGCPVPYSEILTIITSIRKEIKQDDETAEALSKEILEYVPSGPSLHASETKLKHTRVPSNKSKTPIKPVKKTQAKVTQSHHHHTHTAGRKPVQSPMTKISHILPNGEKVEINVQLSGGTAKDSLEVSEEPQEQEQEQDLEASRSQEEFIEGEEEDPFLPQDDDADEGLFEEEIIPGENSEAAISASYELDDEKIDDDFRKPSPLEIFNKISLKKTTTPTPISTTPSTTTTISNTPKRVVAQNLKPKPKPPTTAKPRPLKTTKRPTKRPSTTPRQPTVKPRRPLTTGMPVRKKPHSSSSNKRPNKVTTTTEKTKRPSIKVSSNLGTKRPTKPKATTTTIKPLRAPLSKRRKPSTSTTESTVEEEEEPQSIVTSTSTTQSPRKKSKLKPKSTKAPSTTTTTTTPKSTTLPPLALFTKNVMDDVIEGLYTIKEIPNRYSTLSSYNSETVTTAIKAIPTSQIPSQDTSSGSSSSSIESGTSSEIKLNQNKKEEVISQLFNFEKVKVTTTEEPQLFQSNKRTSGEDQKLTSGQGSKKKRIKYKNAKLPHLVVMNAATMQHPNPDSFSAGRHPNHRNRPKQSSSKLPHYSVTKHANNATKSSTGLSIDYPVPILMPRPQVYEATHVASASTEQEQPYWVPNF